MYFGVGGKGEGGVIRGVVVREKERVVLRGVQRWEEKRMMG